MIGIKQVNKQCVRVSRVSCPVCMGRLCDYRERCNCGEITAGTDLFMKCPKCKSRIEISI